MPVGFEIGVVVTNVLITIGHLKGILLVDFPFGTDGIADFLNIPCVEQFGTDKGGQLNGLDLVFHLQPRPKDVLAFATIAVRLSVPGLVVIVPPLVDGDFRAIGVLPTLTQGHIETTEVDIARQRDIETMARDGKLTTLLRVAHFYLLFQHEVVVGIIVADTLHIGIMEQRVACRQFQLL